MGTFALIGLILNVLPGLITAVESIFGAVKGQGPVKKDAVMGAVNGIVGAVATLPGNKATAEQAPAIAALASASIDALVQAYNAVGHFTGKPPLVIDSTPVPAAPGADK